MGSILQEGWTGSCFGIGTDQWQTGNVAWEHCSGTIFQQRTKLEDRDMLTHVDLSYVCC